MELAEYDAMFNLEGSFWWYRALHKVVAQRLLSLNLPMGAKLLDAGCGTGGMLDFLQFAAPHYKPDIIGLEWHEKAAQLARNKIGPCIVQGDINNMPFANNLFDVVISQDVLYHQNVNETESLNNMFHCIKPGGWILLSLPAYQWMSSSHDKHVHGARRYTTTTCRHLLEQTGFTNVRAGYWNSILFPLMVLQRLTLGKQQESSDVHALPAWLDALLFTTLDFERRVRLQLPFGGSVWAQAIKPGHLHDSSN